MALQVWLPLTKDTRNQGLVSNAINWTTAASFTNNGKLGKALTTGGCKMPANMTSQILNNTAVSIACWLYVNADADDATNRAMIFGNDTMSSLGGRQFSIFRYPNSDDIHLSWQSAANGSVVVSGVWSGVLTPHAWNHICLTYQNPNVKIYVNGVQVGSTSGVMNASSFAYDTDIIHSSSSHYINDFRIYDHCLSLMEVKELAKGLVLHYPLNRNGWGQENLIANSNVEKSGKGGIILYDLTTTGVNTVLGKTMRISADIKSDAANSILDCYVRSSASQSMCSNTIFTNIGTDYKRYTMTTICNINQSSTPQWFAFRCNGSNGTTSTATFTIKNVKLEIGENTTPWSPASSDALATTMGLNSTTEYDCSGFCNNGEYYAYDTNGSISYTSDTPKYNVSTHIASANPTQNAASGTRYLYGHCELTSPTQMSVAFWLKPITGGYGGATSNGQGYFCTTNYEYGSTSVGGDYQTSAMNHRDGAVNMNDSASTTQCNVTFYPTIGEWHHYVYTYDGQVGRGYKDGVQTATAQFSAAKTLDSFIGVVIGFSKAGGVWRRNDACYSDFRIYATALSASDVKSLYQNCATIDPDGTIRGQIRS